MSFKDEMKDFDDQWEEDKAKAGSGGKLPDGPHQAMVTEAVIQKKKDDDTYTWVIRFQNADGSIRKWLNLDHEVGRSIAAQDAAMMGYEGKLSDLEDWLAAEEPIGLICEINVVTKPGGERDFTNVYLNRVLGKGSLDDFGGSQGSQGSDDDIPF